ncbi:MAG: sigma 54-interacting transcriptional regulator [Desulfohalobiaceae bacterium]
MTRLTENGPWDSASILKEVWEHSFDPFLLLDRAYRPVSVNPAMERFLGSLRDRGLADPETELIGALRQLRVLESGKSQYNALVEVGGKSCLAILVVQEEGLLVLLREQSETERSREEITHLEETVRELNEIIDLSADGLVSVDSQGTLLRMNRAYENIVGVRASDFVGKPAIELKKQGYLPDLVSLHVLKDMQPKNLFVQLRERDVLITGRPVFNSEGEFIRIVANIRDLTELNALKEELKKYYELTDRYETELKQLRARELATDLVSCSPSMKKVVDMAVQASQADATVLISGETGTGKEIVARIIHRSGQRKDYPFISVNCAALPETLSEAELFGYESGAFTGAHSRGKMGLFEAAQGGILFLDEVAELSESMQAKLLRAIQEKRVRRIGGTQEIDLDVRLVAATNKDLKQRMEQGGFREDLFYRLNVIHISILPLRRRREDIPLLAEHFLNHFNRKYGTHKELSRNTTEGLIYYQWPGNVRELENIVERLVVFDRSSSPDTELLPERIAAGSTLSAHSSLREIVEKAERDAVLQAYEECRSTRKAAERLQISQATLSRKLRKYSPY